jgi:hypothetical protein
MLSGLAAYDGMATSMDIGGDSQMVLAEAVSANYADVLQLSAQAGRWFTAEDDRPGADPVVVLGDGTWTRHFGRSAGAIGQRIRLEAGYYRIIGVAPRGFIGVSPPHTTQLWVPFQSQRYVKEALANPGERERPRVRMIGRLASGVTLLQAEADLNSVDAQIVRDFPRDNPPTGRITVDVAAGASMPAVREMVTPIVTLLLTVTGIVLLIACVNVTNLLLSRSAVRRREMAVRLALGAGRWRLARQTLAEGLVLAGGGALLGLVFGYAANELLARSLPALPHVGIVKLDLQMNWRVALFAACAAFASALIFTLSPASSTPAWTSAFSKAKPPQCAASAAAMFTLSSKWLSRWCS